MKQYKHIKNTEALKKKLNAILEEIHKVEDPHSITEYRTFFKKNVSFFHRTFVSAYLLKKYLASSSSSNNAYQDRTGNQRIGNQRTGNQKTGNQKTGNQNMGNRNKERQQTRSQEDSSPHKENNRNRDRDDNHSQGQEQGQRQGQGRTRRISVNVGSEFATDQEVIAFLLSAENIQKEDINLFKQTLKHTVFIVNSDKTSDLLRFTKANTLKDKKVYIDLRGQY